MSFPLQPSLFILPGAISLLFPSSLLDAFQHRGLIFWSHIFLPFHTVHGVLEARTLKWLPIPFFSGPHSIRTLHHYLSILDVEVRATESADWDLHVFYHGCKPRISALYCSREDKHRRWVHVLLFFRLGTEAVTHQRNIPDVQEQKISHSETVGGVQPQ